MTDVFISYRRRDRERCAGIAKALQDVGFSVWFDAKIEPGTSFDREIERAIREAKAVLVLWSSEAVESDWVRNEARIGKRADKLIAIRLDECEPPLEFSSVQTIDLFAGSTGEQQAEWDRIVSRVAYLVERPADAMAPLSHSGREPAAASTGGRRWLIWAGGVAAAAALAISLLQWWQPTSDAPATTVASDEAIAGSAATTAAPREGPSPEPVALPNKQNSASVAAPTVPDGPKSAASVVQAPPPRSDSMPLSCDAGPFILFYDYEKTSLTPEAKAVLEQVVLSYFSGCNGARINVSVYADASLKANEAMVYTRRKAASVARYLTSQDIPGDMIRTEAFGKGVPRVATADGVREAQNRRVEITFGPG